MAPKSKVRFDEHHVPQPPRFLFITRTLRLVLAIGVVWGATELIRQFTGDTGWHLWDDSIFFASALVGMCGFLREALSSKAWPISSSIFLVLGYYLTVMLSGAVLAYW